MFLNTLGAFSTGVFNTNALPRINIGAYVWVTCVVGVSLLYGRDQWSGKSAAGGMSEDHDRCFSTLVLGAFSSGVFNTNALPRINIGADVWGESSIMTGVY